jgi:hypothetical protein
MGSPFHGEAAMSPASGYVGDSRESKQLVRRPTTNGCLHSIARRGDRRRAQANRLLRPQRSHIERQSRDQEKTDKIKRIGLRRRDRLPQKSSERRPRIGVVFHAAVLLDTEGNWKGPMPVSAHPAAGFFGSSESASSAERLSADETIRMRLPMASIRRPNANGAIACAIRAGAPIMPSR